MLNQYLKIAILSVLGLLTLTNCATGTAQGPAGVNDNAPIIGNKDSMVAPHNEITDHYSLQILSNGVVGNNYVRITSVKMDDIPVIAAISCTSLKNHTFVNILKNSGTTSIGKSLFAEDSGIKRRGNFQISTITVADIKNPTILSYIKNLGYKDTKKIIVRKSIFYHHQEIMMLTEYILPSVEDYTNFYLTN